MNVRGARKERQSDTASLREIR
ncbi:protein of unknown function [Burkholderia multivorans]